MHAPEALRRFAAVAQYVFEFTSPGSVSDAAFEAIKKVMTPREITDVTMTSAYYVTLDSQERLKAELDWQKKRDLETKSASRKEK